MKMTPVTFDGSSIGGLNDGRWLLESEEMRPKYIFNKTIKFKTGDHINTWHARFFRKAWKRGYANHLESRLQLPVGMPTYSDNTESVRKNELFLVLHTENIYLSVISFGN